MLNTILIGERSFENDRGETVRLTYYLIEECRDMTVGAPLYGVRIIKQTRNRGRFTQERETQGAISYSKELVLHMLDKLLNGMVTPSAMPEILDDLISQESCV